MTTWNKGAIPLFSYIISYKSNSHTVNIRNSNYYKLWKPKKLIEPGPLTPRERLEKCHCIQFRGQIDKGIR